MIPIGNVDRIMKEALSKDCNLPSSSTAFVQACLSKFITRLTTVRFHC
jgi:histone H3/H4